MRSESTSEVGAGTAERVVAPAPESVGLIAPSGTAVDADDGSSPSRGAPAPSALDGEGDRHPRRWFLFRPVAVYVLCRAVTLASLAVADLFTHHGLGGDLYIWDAHWFLRAAVHGWPGHLPVSSGHVVGSTLAFFPLFPLVIRWLSALTSLSPLAVGVAVSGATGLTAVIAVGMVVREFAGSQKAEHAALLFTLFPGSFVFSLVYSEGIVITCVAFGLLALLRRRWWLAGLLGLVASATSPIALAFVISCAWCAGVELVRHRNWRSLLAPLLAPLGFVGYMVWLWVHTGSPSAWRVAERVGWKSYPSLHYPIHIVTTFVSDPVAPTRTGQLLLIGTVVAVIGAVLAIRQHQPAPVLLYGLAAAALAAISAPVGLRPRFLLLAFPLVVAIGTRLRGRAYAGVVALSVCLLLVMSLSTLASTAVFP
jgi:Mannosyltransferase (PIG-V)